MPWSFPDGLRWDQGLCEVLWLAAQSRVGNQRDQIQLCESRVSRLPETRRLNKHPLSPEVEIADSPNSYIETDLNLELAKIQPDVQYYFQEAPPVKRLGQPKDIAWGVVYLLSDAAAYVTGIDLRIDGGMSAGSGLTR